MRCATDLTIDCATRHCGDAGDDGYDDTRAIFSPGLVCGYRMRNLAAGSLQRSVVTSPADSPSDVICAADPLAESMSEPVGMGMSYGSDDYPVITAFPALTRDCLSVAAARGMWDPRAEGGQAACL